MGDNVESIETSNERYRQPEEEIGRIYRYFDSDMNNRSNQKVSNCPSKGGKLDPGHISITHIEQRKLAK